MNVVIKEKNEFRLIMKKESCLMPVDLNTIEMIREQLKNGEVTHTSTYQFFMMQDELETLAKTLTT